MIRELQIKHIESCAEKGDWSGLLRYYLVCERQVKAPADTALKILESYVKKNSDWAEIYNFVQRFISYEEYYKDGKVNNIRSFLSENESATLTLVDLYWRTTSKIINLEAFVDEFDDILADVKSAVFIAVSIDDALLGASFWRDFSKGFQQQDFLKEAQYMAIEEMKLYGSCLRCDGDDEMQLRFISFFKRFSEIKISLHRDEEAYTSLKEAIVLCDDLLGRDVFLNWESYIEILSMMGRCCLEVSMMEMAIESFEKCIKMAHEAPFIYVPLISRFKYIAESELGLSVVFKNIGQLEKAEVKAASAVEICRNIASKTSDYGSQWMLAYSYGNLGCMQLSQMKLDEADSSFERAEKIVEENGLKLMLAEININKSILSFFKIEFDLAQSILDENILLLDEISSNRDELLISLKMRCYEALGLMNKTLSSRRGQDAENILDYLKDSFAAYKKSLHYSDLNLELYRVNEIRKNVFFESSDSYEGLIDSCIAIQNIEHDSRFAKEALVASESCRSRWLNYIRDCEVKFSEKIPIKYQKKFLRNRDFLRILNQGASSFPMGKAVSSFKESSNQDAFFRFGVVNKMKKNSDLTKPPLVESGKNIVELLSCKDGLVDAIRRYDESFTADNYFRNISFEEMASLIPTDKDTAIIQYYIGEKNSYAFILHESDVSVVSLDELNSNRMSELGKRWVTEVQDELIDPAADLTRRQDKLDHFLSIVCELVLMPLVASLSGYERLIFSPHKSLHMFPLHACRVSEGAFLGDLFEVVYSPSISQLFFDRNRRKNPEFDALFLGGDSGDLDYVDAEIDSLEKMYEDKKIISVKNANLGNFLKSCESCKVIHFAGHSVFDFEEPSRSSLVFRDSFLSVKSLLEGVDISATELVILNGCKSGFALPDLMDEHISLAGAFMYAGASVVISSLWNINDLSSFLVMSKFHYFYLNGDTPSSALKKATRWLRYDITTGQQILEEIAIIFGEESSNSGLKCHYEKLAVNYIRDFPDSAPFSSPIFWAAYTVSGIGDFVD